jgi:hypothetical protein
MLVIIGSILILIVCICVKLFDDTIRPNHWLKVVVNTTTFLGLGLIVAGFIKIIYW